MKHNRRGGSRRRSRGSRRRSRTSRHNVMHGGGSMFSWVKHTIGTNQIDNWLRDWVTNPSNRANEPGQKLLAVDQLLEDLNYVGGIMGFKVVHRPTEGNLAGGFNGMNNKTDYNLFSDAVMNWFSEYTMEQSARASEADAQYRAAAWRDAAADDMQRREGGEERWRSICFRANQKGEALSDDDFKYLQQLAASGELEKNMRVRVERAIDNETARRAGGGAALGGGKRRKKTKRKIRKSRKKTKRKRY